MVAKELPILFRDPMVRAILAGRKTQTRRIVKYSQPSGRNGYWPAMVCGVPKLIVDSNRCNDKPLRCPYGQVGDRLWVRETWTPDHEPFYPHFPICYRADFGPEYDRENGKVFSSEQNAWFPFKWRPSIFMPRSVCRITLEITGVRVERLHDISEDDARAEGVAIISRDPASSHQMLFEPVFGCDHPSGTLGSARECFESGWNKINGPGSWEANPWVWCIEFKRLR